MQVERILFSKGINRALDPRQIGNDELYEAQNVEVIEAGTLSKRKGFGRWSEDADAVFSTTVRGFFIMYDKDGNRYLFVFFDEAGAGVGTTLRVEKNGVFLTDITDFFPSEGYRVRAVVFEDKIFFTNGVDRPRWYKEYNGAHVWLIAGLPYPVRAIEDSSHDFYISRAIYQNNIVGSEELGIELPGIWQYKQTFGYHGFEENEQVEESNAGAQSRAFICQFNTATSLSAALEGYVKSPVGLVPARVDATYEDFLKHYAESAGQDYEDFLRWTRLYRRWKMFADQLYSPFEFLAEFKKTWPSSIGDVYDRDAAMVAPQSKVFPAAGYHVEAVNNRLFIGNISKQLFTQPGLPSNFRGLSTYKPNFQKRIPITIQNTNQRTMTAVTIPLRFYEDTAANHGTVATPPSAGGNWYGAWLNTTLDLAAGDGGWYQMVFVDEDGVSPLGFFRVGTVQVGGHDTVTFLVELPEIAAASSRTIYLYFEDVQLTNDPESYEYQVGHWKSVAHYPLLESTDFLLIDFENWESGMAVTSVTQKRSLGYLSGTGFSIQRPVPSPAGVTSFFNTTSKNFSDEAAIYVAGNQIAYIPFWSDSDSAVDFTIAVLLYARIGNSISIKRAVSPYDTVASITFTQPGTDTITATIYGESGSTTLVVTSGSDVILGNWNYVMLSVSGDVAKLNVVTGLGTGHPGEGSQWSTSGKFYTYEDTDTFDGPVTLYSDGMNVLLSAGSSNTLPVKEVQISTRIYDGNSELMCMFMRDAYWKNMGYASAGTIESATASKFPDRFYFSELNSPNSWQSLNFRDLGNRGDGIQGLKGLRNRLYVFTENQVRALFAAGAEQAIGAGVEDTMMWNLSNDLTGQIGGLGVMAPDSLVAMEFAGRDGVGFLSKRGFYFFDGQNFEHLSLKIDNLIFKEDLLANKVKINACFHPVKRQLYLFYDDLAVASERTFVANLFFASTPDEIVYTEWGIRMQYGVILNLIQDTGDFVFVKPYISEDYPAYLAKLEGNSGDYIYADHRYGEGAWAYSNVATLVWSKHFYLFDSEILSCDVYVSHPIGDTLDLFTGLTLKVYSNPTNILGTPPTPTFTKTGVDSGLIRIPVGLHGHTFMFELYNGESSDMVFEQLIFQFNRHGHRRV